MKVTAIIILTMFFFLTSSAQHKFELSGTIPPQYKGVDIILSSRSRNSSAFTPIRAKEKNGKFYFSGEIKQDYELAFLAVLKVNKFLGGKFLFIGAQHMKIDIVKLNESEPLNDFRFFNVPFIEELKEYERLTKPISDSAQVAFKLWDDAKRSHLKENDQDSLWTIVSALRKKHLIQKIKFVESFPNAYVSLYLFDKEIVNSYHLITPDRLNAVYDKLSNDLKENDLGKSVKEYIKKKQSLTVGHVFPNFSFSTDKVQHFELSSFCINKKFVLLCLWSNGCAPCIKKMPALKMINKKYESKGLQLVSVSLDKNADAWLNSLKRHEMPWLQTCDLPAYIQGDRIEDVLDITHIPQYFLIDNKGRLVYHNEQSNDDDEFNVLQKLLDSQL
jgi:thiol-disulfide isomerase/thioredoxin